MTEYLFPLYVLGSLLLTLFAITLSVVLVIQKQRQKRNLLEKQMMEQQHQQELLSTRLNVQEQSMTLVSEEIHDHIGQLLALTKMRLTSAIVKTANEESKELIVRSRELLEQIINDLRHITHSLNSDLIHKMGLIQLLQRDIEYLNDSTNLDCSLNLKGEHNSFTPEQNLLIYRIIQETIQNILKHAEASLLTIDLIFDTATTQVIISDNGVGFNVEAAKENNSLGLRNIFNRAKILNADLEIKSDSTGSILEMRIPCI